MKSFAGYGLVVLFSLIAILRPTRLESANLTSVKDTLQTSRLSVNARVDATGTAVDSSRVKLKTSESAPSYTTSTANLRTKDSLIIGTGTYEIVDIVDADEFDVSPVLLAGDTDDDDPIYLKMSPQHSITFSTKTAVSGGYFRILLPADATTPNDGNPDDEGFDFNTSVDVVASDAGVYDFVTGVATASGGTGCTSPANYHCFEVHYSGPGSIGQAITITIGNTDGSDTPIAPAPGNTTEATAETYPVIIKNYDNNDLVVDQSTAQIALIESVRVTATVDPTIGFSITGVDTGTTTCGATPDIDTTTGTNAPLAVPFGTMVLNTFKDASHKLTVSTNAASGYVVTAAENDQLSKDGLGVTTIPDTDCDGEDCTISSDTEWVTSTDNGFGYSLDNVDAAYINFEWDDTTPTTGFSARPFAVLGTDTPTTLFYSDTVANAEDIYVCYRLGVGATQASGDYENQITYTATGTF
ncbi:MAG: hypothetical protein ABII21_03705 [bacterium]